MSNTKLTPEQKQERKGLIEHFGSDCYFVTSVGGGVTAFVCPEHLNGRGRMAVMSVSIASPKELKIRRKVGEYHALRRMVDYQAIHVHNDSAMIQDMLDIMAYWTSPFRV